MEGRRGALALCLLALAAVAAAMALHSSRVSASSPPSLNAEAQGAFALLRTPPVAQPSAARNGLPAAVAISRRGGADFVSDAHRAAPPAPGWDVWAAAGDSQLCITGTTPLSGANDQAKACAPIEYAVKFGVFLIRGGSANRVGAYAPGQVTVMGAVPDDVDHVDITLIDGTVREVQVEDNSVVADLSTGIRTISLAIEDGSSRSIPVNMEL